MNNEGQFEIKALFVENLPIIGIVPMGKYFSSIIYVISPIFQSYFTIQRNYIGLMSIFCNFSPILLIGVSKVLKTSSSYCQFFGL